MNSSRRSPLTILPTMLLLALISACALPGLGPRFAPAGLADRVVLALLVDPTGALLAGTSDGIHHSADAGRSWEAAIGLPPETTVPGLSRGPNGLYAATGRGAFHSVDGHRWTALGTGLPLDGPLLSLIADPTEPHRLLAGASRRGIYRSDDGGATWSPSSTGLPRELPIYVLAPDPIRPGRLLAGTLGGGLHRSDDGGRTWQPAGAGIPLTTNVFSIIGAGARGLAVGASVGFFRSDDGGETWQWSRDVLGHTRVIALAVDPSDPRRLVAGADDGVWQSPDAGRTWRRLADGLPPGEHVGAVAILKGRIIVGAGQAWALDG